MEATPQLLQQLQVFMPKARADTTALALHYQQVFGVPLNTRCNVCINDGIAALQKFLQQQLQTQQPPHTMQNYKWTSDTKYADATVTMRIGGKMTAIHARNITPEIADILRNTPKYMHLIEEVTNGLETPGEQTAKSETTASPTSVATTSTSILQPSAAKTAKARKKKQPSA
jgi:hypothetical protein